MSNPVWRGRIIFLTLVLMFALPAILAKTVLTNHWYQSGVTNRGVLIEPSVSYQTLGIDNPYAGSQWQLAYVMPSRCEAFCQQQLYLLGQSHTALGKYQDRVSPVLLVRSDNEVMPKVAEQFSVVNVSGNLNHLVSGFEVVIVDPLGQLVMRYPKVKAESDLVQQSKDVLADLRKLLKLSRVG
ncbi:hypothetical protein OH458_18670 [Vibrio sp. MarTm2]|uniref:hypothetical protein n=1 Tax=Vibrio sp. MarTm2 TaxID=2998831 RepID=UPI0022CD4225|nr:hypothetical protein [Vibrio sp. MarTm2]MDA0130101.1 hypothetical protein [Vibrio sp. MarTm2]